jgi:hypothetical protein
MVLCVLWPRAEIAPLLEAVNSQTLLSELVWMGLAAEPSEQDSRGELMQVFFKTSQREIDLTKKWLTNVVGKPKLDQVNAFQTQPMTKPKLLFFVGKITSQIWEDSDDNRFPNSQLFNFELNSLGDKVQNPNDENLSVIFGSFEAGELHKLICRLDESAANAGL